MAIETTDYPAALDFLRRAHGAQDPRTPLHVGLEEEHRHFRSTGVWRREYRVLVSGWMRLDGVMVLTPEDRLDADWRAGLAARNERALLDLLLAFPAGRVGLFHCAQAWMGRALAEIFDGQLLPGGLFVGMKPGHVAWEEVDPRALLAGERVRRGRGEPDAVDTRPVTQRKDPLCIEFSRLTALRHREARSSFVAEGTRLVRRALEDGLPAARIFHTAELARDPDGQALLERARAASIPHHRVSAGLMGSLTTTRPAPPVVAAIRIAWRDARTFHLAGDSPLLVADSIANPDNLGLVLRTADAAGVDAVLILGTGASPLHKNAVRSARGAVGRLPLLRCPHEEDYLDALARAGWSILATSAHAQDSLYSLALRDPVAIVVGSESEGIRPAILEHCTHRARIPMAPGQSSLNVGVAAGVLLYEAVRRRSERLAGVGRVKED